MELTLNNRHHCFGGKVEFYSHLSKACGIEMRFSLFLPPQAEHGKVPVLFFLSGLTCTEENFMAKAGAQRTAAKHGIALVCPDTSPRGAGVEGEDLSYDLGTGAGFYVDATQPKWAKHYQMYSYVTDELPQLVAEKFPVDGSRISIFGHSMGGHGALVAALRQPGRYQSVSAFAPICAPSQCEWGEKVFKEYLGNDVVLWKEWDANELVSVAKVKQPILIDQGKADAHLPKQLRLDTFLETCRRNDYPVEVTLRPGYDHGYYYISTFIDEHLDYHAKFLLK